MMLINTIFYGLTVGGILYIISIGLSLTFGMMRIVNFAHALIYTISAYFLITLLPLLDNSFVLGALISIIAIIPISFAIEKWVIRRLYGVSIDSAIIATYAVLLIGVDLIKWVWGATPIPLGAPMGRSAVTLFDISLPSYRLVVILVAVIVYFLNNLFFSRTLVGKIVVAALEDKEAVRGLGIKVDKYFSIVFIFGSCLAGLGGVLYAPIVSVHPYMGFTILLICFAVVIVGGLGNIQGTAVSSLLLGVVMALTGRYWPPAAEVIVFIIMVIALILKPIEV
jgi:branched-chain amino acid transport system permease protein